MAIHDIIVFTIMKRGIGMTSLFIVKEPKVFLEKVESTLLKKEAENNLMLGLSYASVKQDPQGHGYLFGFVEDKDDICLCFIKTPGRKLIVANTRPIHDYEWNTLIEQFMQTNIQLPGIVGPRQEVERFVALYQQKMNAVSKLNMEQLIYQLDAVKNIEIGNGTMRVAAETDLDIVTKWIYEFSKITSEVLTKDESRKLGLDLLTAGSIYLWIYNDTIVSMARKSRPSKNGIVLSLVYTPVEFRKKGFASSLVATLSQLLLKSGYSFCSLYTDLSNPTSNHIYSEIGYKPVAESLDYSFTY